MTWFRLPLLLGSAVAGSLLTLAWHLKHPLMLWLRPWETPLLLCAGIVGAVFLIFQKPALRRLFGLALVLSGILGLYRELEFQEIRARVLAADPDMRLLGPHFIVGVTDFAAVEPLAERGLIGGIYLTRRNLKQGGISELAARVAQLQHLRRRAGLPPLIVAADQEGGAVSHLSPPLEAMPALSSLTGPEAPDILAARAHRYGERQGAALASVGVNLNFGPVVDLRPASAFSGDRLTRIASRAIDSDPAVVSAIAQGYVAGLAQAGVGATLKHFPGLGRVRADTHFSQARLSETPGELADDWHPFREAPPQAAIMVGHVFLTAVDEKRAASHSRSVVQGLLREQLGFRGPLITDDLNMGAVYGQGIGKIAAEALAAGIDLVLVSYDPDQYFRAIAGAADGEAKREKARSFLPPALARTEERGDI